MTTEPNTGTSNRPHSRPNRSKRIATLSVDETIAITRAFDQLTEYHRLQAKDDGYQSSRNRVIARQLRSMGGHLHGSLMHIASNLSEEEESLDEVTIELNVSTMSDLQEDVVTDVLADIRVDIGKNTSISYSSADVYREERSTTELFESVASLLMEYDYWFKDGFGH